MAVEFYPPIFPDEKSPDDNFSSVPLRPDTTRRVESYERNYPKYSGHIRAHIIDKEDDLVNDILSDAERASEQEDDNAD